MRDLLVTAMVLGAIFYAFRRPWVGVMLWTWLSIMNPHRLTWGFAFDAPFAAMAAGVTMLSLLLTRSQ
jgi:putative inorganic carbon (HCO3(-)) transporter